MSRSFRPEFAIRAPGYRTPSPPHAAVEPLSPPLGWLPNLPSPYPPESLRKRKLDRYRDAAPHKARHEAPSPLPLGPHAMASRRSHSALKSRSPPSALDVFAAVATSPSLTQDMNSPSAFQSPSMAAFPPGHTPLADPVQERASKRSRSEVYGQRPVIVNETRPITSHVAPSSWDLHHPTSFNESSNGSGNQPSASPHHEILEQDAELLLMFSRGSYDQRVRDVDLCSQSYPANGLDHLAPRSGREPLDIPSLTAHRSRESKPLLPVLGLGADTNKASALERYLAVSRSDGAPLEGMAHINGDLAASQYLDTTQQDQAKPREHRGWPKGKPRGPRAPITGRKKRSEAGSKRADGRDLGALQVDRRRGSKKKELKAQDNTSLLDDPFAVRAETRRPRRHSFDAVDLNISRPGSDLKSARRSSSAPPDPYTGLIIATKLQTQTAQNGRTKKQRSPSEIEFCAMCPAVNTSSNDIQQLWMQCDGCKLWIHAACAGFESKEKADEVNKFHCKKCMDKHGPNTFVRKSARAHASVDYAGLNEGKVRTAENVVGHHYIEPIKDGTLQFQPETFPRMPPELVTAEYFAKIGGWTEPILIPAALNPRPTPPTVPAEKAVAPDSSSANYGTGLSDAFFTDKYTYDCVLDDGQDKLDMVIPHGLTVRRVAELHGPDEQLDVIDVKLQEGDRWTLGRWADYYEAEGEKPVRNVISLEVSRSMLGRLIRRPKVVRDLDLQDSVWPEEEAVKGSFPRVQFYCLMSVADCFTDFHIDFGGSSVYYHILKGRKTFFFIPPKPKYLKKYEEWCNSPDQNSVFLGNETKECYRVDLYPGDTMLIPSGWIHAVWTPEDSLVIGGNFLTRLHYTNQIAVNDIEKATSVAPRFRYPFFQRILWLTAIRYLDHDPVPSSIVESLCSGGVFERKVPVWYDGLVEEEQEAEDGNPELYNARYYPESEIEGLPDLIRFVHRTVLISQGKLPNITKKSQEAVGRSIPKGYGEPAELLQTFAIWVAWKRGNEPLPPWAFPNAALTGLDSSSAENKTSVAAQKRLDRQAQHEANKLTSRRSLRQSTEGGAHTSPEATPMKSEDANAVSPSEPRRAACDECRRRRRRCMHNAVPAEAVSEQADLLPPRFGVRPVTKLLAAGGMQADFLTGGGATPVKLEAVQTDPDHLDSVQPPVPDSHAEAITPLIPEARQSQPRDSESVGQVLELTNNLPSAEMSLEVTEQSSPGQVKKPKTRACVECKKSKRRCIHDENGQVDPIKQQETPIARGQANGKRSKSGESGSRPGSSKKAKLESLSNGDLTGPSAEGQQRPLDAEPKPIAESIANGAADETAKLTATGSEPLAVVARSVGLGQGPGESQSGISPGRKDRSRSRTSSSNQHTSSSESAKASHSAAASPLTEPDIIPPYVYGEGGPVELIHSRVGGGRQETPQRRKQGERPSDMAADKHDSPSERRRYSGPSSSPRHSVAKANGAEEQKGSLQSPAYGEVEASPVKQKSKSPGLFKGTGTADEEDDESLKLAKLLAGQDYGLRRRGR